MGKKKSFKRLAVSFVLVMGLVVGTSGFQVVKAAGTTGWVQDSRGWKYLQNGVQLQQGWAQDTGGWCYIEHGYWVNHELWAKDSVGYCHINSTGHWDGQQQLSDIPLNNGETKCSVIDVGQGESILVQSKNASGTLFNMLIDGGGDNDLEGGNGGQAVLNYLNAHGATHINVLVSTHPHGDHQSGLDTVINSTGITIDKVYMSDVPALTEFTTALTNKGITTGNGKLVQVNDWLGIVPTNTGSCNVKIYGARGATADYNIPDGGETDSINTHSLMVIVTANTGTSYQKKFLFTGDIHHMNEDSILGDTGVRSQFQNIDVLKLAHHAHATSNGSAFINWTNPKYAIASVGQYGYTYWDMPANDVLASLNNVNGRIVNMLNTRLDSTIVWETKANGTIIFNHEPQINSLQY